MSFLTALNLFLRRNVNERATAPNMMMATPNALTVLESPKPRLKEKAGIAKVTAIQGTCGYNAFRRFLFKSAYPQAGRELIENARILVERDTKPAQIYVEADGKETLYETEDEIRIVRVKYVIGIIYHSRSGNTELRWRDDKPRGKIWGKVTRRSLGLLLCYNAQIKTTSTSTNS